MPKPLPEIVKCRRCGRISELDEDGPNQEYQVVCSHRTRKGWISYCWIGPIMKTARGAISAWNKVMGDGE